MERYDVVIVGGGMAGLSCVAALEPAIANGLCVAVVDPSEKPVADRVNSPSFDDRATALSAQAIQTFHALNIKGLDAAITNISEIEVSDQGHAGYLHLQAQSQKLTRFGAVIANRTLGSILWRHVSHQAVSWLFNQQVTDIRPISSGHQLRLNTNQTIHANLVILCDGGRSGLQQKLALPSAQHPFKAHARIATVKTSKPHNGQAFERFTPLGPIALLPFHQFSALVWTVPDNKLDQLPSSPSEAINWLNQQFGQRLGAIEEISSWQEYPLTEKQLISCVGHNFIALGNAATTLHPVAGQGFNLAVRGIVKTAHLINNLFLNEQILPNFQQLNELAENIRRDQQITAQLSRTLIQVFESRSPLLQLARGVGLSAMDRHPLLQKSFALAGMGLLEKIPNLHSLNLTR